MKAKKATKKTGGGRVRGTTRKIVDVRAGFDPSDRVGAAAVTKLGPIAPAAELRAETPPVETPAEPIVIRPLIADVIDLFTDQDGMSAVEIGLALTARDVDWTPDALGAALREAVETKRLVCVPVLDEDTYALPAAPGERDFTEELLAELHRILLDEHRLKETRTLECALTEDERRERRERAGQLRHEQKELEAKAEAVAKELKRIKDRIAVLSDSKDDELDTADAGIEYRDVECVKLRSFRGGFETVFRVDTMVELEGERVPLEGGKRQGDLYTDAAPATAGAMS
jgi:hypothetical protein